MKLLRNTSSALLLVACASLAWGQTPPADTSSQKEEATPTRTAKYEDNEKQLVSECVEKLKAEDEGITDYNAGKACREHVEKQSDRTSGG